MTRPIEFKVRDLKENKWVSQNIVIDYAGLLFWSYGYENRLIDDPERYDVLFFTGLLDKNGKKMFQGDIVLRKSNIRYEVYWCEYQWRLSPFGERQFDKTTAFLFPNQLEVIGNIYENPELMKSSK
jgi:hypothetical protein